VFTFIIASLNRGAQTLYEHFPEGFAFSVLVHDCWKCYFKASERAIRHVKVKQKICGQFRSWAGAENFAILRSVIDTAIKNNLNPLHSLSQIYALSL
jgi:hypothetical protein